MSRIKRYTDVDVLTESRRRLHHIYDIHDDLIVSFSGGKDSQVLLELTWEVAQERGLDHVNALFYDEEVIPSAVLEHVETYRQKPWVNLLWLAVPLWSRKFILGKTTRYIQWDPARAHVRPKPAWATTLPEGDDRVLDQHGLDDLATSHFTSAGKVCHVMGLRAEESIYRYRGVVVKLHDNYIFGGQGGERSTRASPLYDWMENDIFRYFYDRGLTYCRLYDQQTWSGRTELRVSTPLHPQSAKRIAGLKHEDPIFYEQVISVFPEMAVQERYWSEWNDTATREAMHDQYGQSIAGLRAFCMDHIDDDVDRSVALRSLRSLEPRIKSLPERYPLRGLLNWLMAGQYHKRFQEVVPK